MIWPLQISGLAGAICSLAAIILGIQAGNRVAVAWLCASLAAQLFILAASLLQERSASR